MSAVCELSGKNVKYGNNVSHSHRKTRRKYKPNLKFKYFFCAAFGINVGLRVSTRIIKSLDKFGGFDQFMIKSDADKMSLKLKRMRKKLLDYYANLSTSPEENVSS